MDDCKQVISPCRRCLNGHNSAQGTGPSSPRSAEGGRLGGWVVVLCGERSVRGGEYVEVGGWESEGCSGGDKWMWMMWRVYVRGERGFIVSYYFTVE